MTYDAYVKKVETLKRWAHAYYVEDNPVATDEEYDRLYHEVQQPGKRVVRFPGEAYNEGRP